jgi:hypothetical protein
MLRLLSGPTLLGRHGGEVLNFFWGPARVTLSESGQRLGVPVPAPESTHIYEWDGTSAYSAISRGIPGGSSISMKRGGLRVILVGRPASSEVSVYDNVDGDWVDVAVTGESSIRFGHPFRWLQMATSLLSGLLLTILQGSMLDVSSCTNRTLRNLSNDILQKPMTTSNFNNGCLSKTSLLFWPIQGTLILDQKTFSVGWADYDETMEMLACSRCSA